jgi:hypothetical protein
MKTSQVEKFELLLAGEEDKLRRHLVRVLPEAADTGSSVFTNSEFNPSNLPAHLFRSDAETLLQNARECVRLRDLIGLSLEDSVGAKFLAACEEHASNDPQRRGPRKLALSLLEALRHDT